MSCRRECGLASHFPVAAFAWLKPNQGVAMEEKLIRRRGLVLIGPPGGGKGTLAQNLCPLLEIGHLSVGDAFRRVTKSGSDLAKEIEGYVSSGTLAPDHIAVSVVESELSDVKYARGMAVDGCPRRLSQAIELDEMLARHGIEIEWAIVLEPDDDVLIERLSNRLNCRECGSTYHLRTKRPEKEGFCRCGGELYQRPDDVPAVIQKRIDIYKVESRPIIEYYGKKIIMVRPGADEPEDSVLHRVLAQM
jgi:adenylate kinase